METLLWRAYSGDITDTEWEEVEKWIAASVENKEIASRLYHLYVATYTIDAIKHIDVEKALGIVNNRIDNHKEMNILVPPKKSLWTTYMRHIAVAVFIPLIGIIGWQLFKNNNKIEYIEMRSERGRIVLVTLPDSSKVWLNKDSYIRYPSVFNGNKREVYLEGEAYFSVTKSEHQHFFVTTAYHAQIEVMGTEFNVEAHKDNKKIIASLVSGSILMHYKDSHNKEKTLDVKPEERIEYNEETCDVNKEEVACILSDVGWKDSKIILDNSSLQDLLKALRKTHDVEFVLKKESIKNKTFTGTFNDVSLQSILEMLKISSDINYKITLPKEKDKEIIIELY